MTDIEINAIVDILKQQRNAALDAAAMLHGQVADLESKLELANKSLEALKSE